MQMSKNRTHCIDLLCHIVFIGDYDKEGYDFDFLFSVDLVILALPHVQT